MTNVGESRRESGNEEQGREEVEQEEEREGRKPKSKRAPNEPTREEIIEHRLTHTPYRSWCPECVKARGRATDHVSAGGEDRAIPTVHVDYWFMRDQKGAELVTVAAVKDDATKAYAAHVVPQKGNVKWVAETLAN